MRGITYDKNRGERHGLAARPRARVATVSDHDLWRRLMDALWAPVPWMLEALFVLLFALGDYAGMVTVAALLTLDVILCVGVDRCWRPVRRTRRPK
ncbi:MAG TPA: hypothetical protein VGG68_12680 [Caulobacteraceae bacterium]